MANRKQKAEPKYTSGNAAKPIVSRRLDAVARARAAAVEDILIGIIATEMGYANQTLVVRAGQEAFKYISSMSYRQFSNVKKLANGG